MEELYFISGGTGLIGRPIVRRLIQDSKSRNIKRITLLTRNITRFVDRFPDIGNHDIVNLIEGDVVDSIQERGIYTDIIHAACEVNDKHISNKLVYAESIVSATRNMLDLAVNVGAKRFLYVSSGAVYGEYNDSTFSEDATTAPKTNSYRDAYGHAKRYSEFLCTAYYHQYNLNCKIARIFTVIGEEVPLDGQYAVGNFIRDAISNKEIIEVKGNGTAIRSYLHVNDVAEWLLAILRHGEPLQLYNVGSCMGVSIKDLAYQVRDIVAPNKEVRILKNIDKNSIEPPYLPDCSKVINELGVTEKISLIESLNLIKDATKNPK